MYAYTLPLDMTKNRSNKYTLSQRCGGETWVEVWLCAVCEVNQYPLQDENL